MDGVKIVTPQEQGWTKVFSALFLRIVSRCHRAGRFGPGFSRRGGRRGAAEAVGGDTAVANPPAGVRTEPASGRFRDAPEIKITPADNSAGVDSSMADRLSDGGALISCSS